MCSLWLTINSYNFSPTDFLMQARCVLRATKKMKICTKCRLILVFRGLIQYRIHRHPVFRFYVTHVSEKASINKPRNQKKITLIKTFALTVPWTLHEQIWCTFNIMNQAEAWIFCLLWVLCVVMSSGWPHVQRRPIESGVPWCDREASRVRRPWTTRGYCGMEKKQV
jgi:hypothetical protein